MAMHLVRGQLSIARASLPDSALQISHWQLSESQNKSRGLLQRSFERLQKVTGARQTAPDSSLRSQASSSPIAQTSSHLISDLLCIREAVEVPSAASSFVLCCDPYSSNSVPSETELIIQQR